MNEELSPYKTPDSVLGEASNKFDEGYIDAGLGVRFLNYIIDLCAAIVLAIPIIMLAYIILGEVAVDSFIDKTPDFLFGVIVLSPYYIITEGLFGRTLGKLITRSCVVNEDGNNIGFKEALLRTLGRFIPFEIFSFFSDGRGWHDKLSKTHVVKLDKSQFNKN
jgi:uncharacterized RDD family membrane protein YckC